jgi:VWFA-related protein
MRVAVSLGRPLCLAAFGVVALASTVVGQTVEHSVYASVVDRQGAPVTDLDSQDFIVREDGVAREVLRIAPATDPFQIAILVDTSTEATAAVAQIREGVREFVRTMGSGHEMALIGFGARPTVFVDYTRDPDALLEGVGRIFTEPNSGSYLLDALTEVSQGLQKREAARRAIVVVTFQGPEYSNRYHQHVIEQLIDADVVLHAYVVGRPVDLTDDELRERHLTLDLGATATGGRQEDLLSVSSVPSKMAQLAEELTNQYEVVYARPQALIPPESIAVSVRSQGLVVHAPTTLSEE